MTKRGLFISIKETNHPGLPQLPWAHQYARDLRDRLIEKFGYKDIVVMQDTEGVPDGLWPTESNILQQIQLLVKNATDGDRFFIYYSGHGSQVKSLDDNEYDKMDERIATADGKWIIDNVDTHYFLSKKNIRLFAFFDCCHAETMLDLRRDRKYTREWIGGPGRTCNGLFKSVTPLLQVIRMARSLNDTTTQVSTESVDISISDTLWLDDKEVLEGADFFTIDMITPQDPTESLVDTLISDTVWPDSEDGSAEADFCAVSLSACGDGQLAYDDPGNGVTATKIFLDLIGIEHITWNVLRDQMEERIKEMLQQNSDYLPPRRLSLDAEFDARMQHPKYDFSKNIDLTKEVDF